MRLNLYIFIFYLLICCTGFTQLYLPNTNFYHNEANRTFLDDTIKTNYYTHHLSLKPLQENRLNTEETYRNEGKYYYWITQKLFKENFIVFEGDGYWCSIDPIVDLELGTDLSGDSLERMYWNTRGMRIQAKFLNKVAFTTSFYENQAITPNYIREYASNHGEFFPNSTNTVYQQNNAVIAGYSRTKPFKTIGYDFAFAEGNISFTPNKFINFQLGNGNHFIGNGYRSLLLSDFTVNYPFTKIEANFWEGRIQYSAIYALHQNLYRLPAQTTPEATYERKIGSYHYLDFSINKQFQIGIFEGSHWRRTDSLGSHKPDPLFTNPILLLNTAIKGFDNENFSSVLGINASYSFAHNLIYSQAIFDNNTLGGFQIGAKFYDLFLPKFDATVEYNQVKLNTYLSENKRYNYGHYNLPLAHPYVNGFNELVLSLSYQYKRFFIHNRFNYSKRLKNDVTAIGNDLFQGIKTPSTLNSYAQFTIYNQFEIGYRFNKSYNLQAFAGSLMRNETLPTATPLTNYTYIGIRTRLKNKYLDY